MNAEKGGKCCDITQESLLINGATRGSCLLIEYRGWWRDPEERKDRPRIWASGAGFQVGTDCLLEIFTSSPWISVPQADWWMWAPEVQAGGRVVFTGTPSLSGLRITSV